MWFLVLCLDLSLGETGALPPIQSRIIGGWECEKHSKPWQVAVYHQGHFQCGGVLVHPQWVLTAAHCMSDDYQIWLGRHNLSEDEDTAQFHQVSDSFLDPQFDLSLLKKKHLRPYDDISHDLMLLRLAQPARITDAVKILDLPTREPKLGSTCYTSGWGLISTLTNRGSGTLQCVELRLQSNEKCARAYPEKMTEFVLCATHRDDSGSICLGDSGGALICDGVFQGITSWGYSECADFNDNFVFTKVMPHLKWIKETIEKNS
ncbi:kallikrein-1E2 isoform X1 [Equus asinus]|uniref:kallikrein-1E2 isoform X1 n=1 Tax=Equus asinus TaxID=9793 RepID=UPI000FC5D4F3